MEGLSPVDQTTFKRILTRNVSLPLAAGVVSVVLFVSLIFYLLSVLNWVEHSERVIANANEVAKLSVDMESGMRGFLITNDESFLATYEVSKPKIASQMAVLLELVSDNPLQINRVKRIQGLQAQWNSFGQEAIRLRRSNQDYQEIIRAGRGKAIFDEMRREFNDLLLMEYRLRQERSESAKETTFWTVGIYVGLSLILSGLLALSGRRELLNLSGTYDATLQRLKEHTNTLQEKAWLRLGQTQLGEKLTGQLAVNGLGKNTLEFLAMYLGVVVGAFYVREEDTKLWRRATYGFMHDEEHKEQSFHIDEGLVGQATQEKRMLVLKEIPVNYLKVVSGLGSSEPKHVSILPITNEGKVNGVLELGFMRALEQRDLDLLQLIAPNIGTAVEAALYRQRLQDVLTETQQLNEELQVQQEELRTANEELEEQSRVLEESQANLENQKAELEQTNEQLSEQTLALDQKNSALNAIQVELEKRSDDLQRASKYKSEFLANMSHELRTPLNSSLILAKLLADNAKGNLNEEQVKFAETIYSAGNDLLNLINDILDLSKVEAGKLELRPEEIPLPKLVEGLSMVFEPLGKQKKLDFNIRLEPSVPNFIVSDRLRLEQVLKNLLSNAIKFTEKGSVTLSIGRESDDMISFAVQDSGIGIPPDQHELIFDAFHQADSADTRKYGGTGLGLSISRDLSKLLGGSIHLSSTPGKGSTFTFVVPLQWKEAAAAGQSSTLSSAPITPPIVPPASLSKARAGSGHVSSHASPSNTNQSALADDRFSRGNYDRTVLVIEDEPVFAQVLYELAHEMHFRCLVAHRAEEGLALAAEFLPDAVLLDMRLPDDSGLSVLQQLKENLATRHIPVHVVSASEHTEAALHLGAIGYAVKPATRDELKDVFLRLEKKFTQTVKRVLLVEDDARQRESVVQLIGGEDVEITAVERGEDALQQLRTQVFDCMIIDLKLPDIQGHELLQRMASEDICSFPPVIVYTGRNLTREEEAELMKYSRSIIIKGARSPERLVDEVTLFLHKVESQLSSEVQHMLKTVRSRDRVLEGRKILLVDDDVRNIFALTSALEQKGAVIEIGRNGFEAISKLNEVPNIDLVLMDVMMPGMDGLEATRRIRKDQRFQKLPIIAITAKAMRDDQEQCLNAGATDYLPKPLDLDRLYSLLRVWMPHVERHAE